MKKGLLFGMAILLAGSLFTCYTAAAQMNNPVKWAFSAKKINATTYELHMTASVDAGWKLFAQHPGEGPVPTSFTFRKNPQAAFVGVVQEVGKLRSSAEKSFNNSVVNFYYNTVDFVQKVTVKGKAKVTGTVQYMAIDDHQALPPKSQGFAFQVGG